MKKLPIIILALLIASNAFGATQLLKTVKPSGGDYTSLEACMNANEQDLVTADKYFDVEIDGSWSSADTTSCLIHNYTMNSTHYINIYTTGDARHDGRAAAVSGRSNYRLDGASLTMGTMNPTCVTIDGIELYNLAVGAGGHVIDCGVSYSGNTVIIKNNIIHDVTSGVCIYMGGSNAVEYVYNNIIYNCAGNLVRGIFNGAGAGYVYNNTVYNVGGNGNQPDYGYGITGYCSVLKNNIAMNCGGATPYDFTSYTADANHNYNLSSDATALGANSLINKTASNQFVSTTNDMHLKAGADAIDAGADLSGTFTDDIDGVTRSGTWDIGADEYVSVGTTQFQPIFID